MPYQRYPLITDSNLVPYSEAFAQTGEESAQTQSAVLLSLNSLIGPEPAALRAISTDRSMAELVEEEDLAALGIPANLLELEQHRGVQFQFGSMREDLGEDEAERLRGARDFQNVEAEATFRDVQSSLSDQLAQSPQPDQAARLVENSLNHPQSLVRVAAASTAFDLFKADQGRQELNMILEQGLGDEDDLVRELAATVLARVAPDHPGLAALTSGGGQEEPGEPSHTSMLVHGTWARGNSWWQSGGDFHTYILNEVRPDLYSETDRYEWSGGWSDEARSIAAPELEGWVTAHGLSGLDLICHSHGGSVAMLASHDSLQISKLVLLSCPVHTEKYLPNFIQVNDVVSVRVKFDLVILADGGGQRFREDEIRENRLPIWFNHSATHDPDVWREHDVPLML